MTAPYPTKGEIEALTLRLDAASSYMNDGVARRLYADALACITELECRLADALALTRGGGEAGDLFAPVQVILDHYHTFARGGGDERVAALVQFNNIEQAAADAITKARAILALGGEKSNNASQGLGTTVSSALEGQRHRLLECAEFLAEEAPDAVVRERIEDCMSHDEVVATAAAVMLVAATSLSLLSSAKQNEGDGSRDELNTSSQPVKIPPDTEHDGGEV